MPASFLSCWVYSSVCSESTNQAAWVWELSSLRKKPLENVFGQLLLILNAVQLGLSFWNLLCLWCAVFLPLFSWLCVGTGAKHPVSKPTGFPFSVSWLVSLPCATESPGRPWCRRALRADGPDLLPRALSAAPGAEAAPPGVDSACPALPCSPCLSVGWQPCVCTGVCVSLCLCREKVVGRK